MGTTGFDEPTEGLGPLFNRTQRLESSLRTSGEPEERAGARQIPNTGGCRGWRPRAALHIARLGLRRPGHGNPRVPHRVGDGRLRSVPSSGRSEDEAKDTIHLTVSNAGREWTFHFGRGRGSLRNREFSESVAPVAGGVRDPEPLCARNEGGHRRPSVPRPRSRLHSRSGGRDTMAGRSARSEARAPGRRGRQGMGSQLRVARNCDVRRGGQRPAMGQGRGLSRFPVRARAARSV